MKTAIIYARVSSSGNKEFRQSTDRQVEDLKEYAIRVGYDVKEVFEEHISGATRNDARPVLQSCLNFARENHIDIILFSEMSRLSRSVSELHKSIAYLVDNRINAFFQKESFTIFNEDGKKNFYMDILVSVLGTCSELERESISFRLNSGRKRAIEAGVKMGRKVGYRKPKEKIAEERADVIKLLKKSISIRNTAKITGVSISTIQRVKKEFSL